MRILVVNDDGIHAEGISRLANMAVQLGEVWVVAPEGQCSAMSQRITVHGDIMVKKVSFPVAGTHAYSIGGTPADCVKAAVSFIMPEKPDIVFSGINRGYNTGFDIAYSGTVGAAMEALMMGIPAIAFSNEGNGVYDIADQYLFSVTKDLLGREISPGRIWNVNFPGCTRLEFQGIKEECKVAHSQFYADHFEAEEQTDGSVLLHTGGIPVEKAPAGTDIRAVLDHCIAIGQIRNVLLSY